MNHEELKELAKKVVSGRASPEESLSFMKEFNNLLEELKEELKK
ncbi:MAG: hypothetical protein WCW04_03515 [Candidatus Paceibacterota bacterium]|jgi:hypothetical protein